MKVLNQSKAKQVCALLLATALLNACSVAPSSIVKSPTTARPATAQKPAASSGAIYVASSYRPLFEDRRARMVGDILTINIIENTTTSKAAANKASKIGSIDATVAKPIGLPFNMPAIAVAADSDVRNEDKADSAASNKFNGTIGVTVIEVLENGNLVVSGEKQIAFDRGSEFVRFSGVINPDTIAVGNVVPSNKVADARMEYRTNSQIDASQVISILARFFLSFSPI